MPGCQLGITASHGTRAGTAVRDMDPRGTLLLLPIAHCTATNSYTGYFWISHTAAALPGQRDMTPNCPSHRWDTLEESRRTHGQGKALFDKQRVVVCGTEGELGTGSDGAGQTRCLLSLNNTPLTTFHRSLTRESTLRMSACSAPPLIPSVDQGRCPHCFPPRPAASDWAGHLGLDGEPYGSPRDTKLSEAEQFIARKSVEFWLFRIISTNFSILS